MKPASPKIENIKLADLDLPKGGLQVRQAKSDGIEQLAANIEAFGLIQPLLVTRSGAGKTKKIRYIVIDGGRRLTALRSLDKPPATVPCLVNLDAGVEHGISANLHEPTNPMDLSDAFAKMIAAEHKPAAIAAAFSMTGRQVEQHLALAKLSPQIKAKVREGKVSWETAQALTVAGDHQTQERLLKRHGNYGHMIRRALTDDAPQIRHALFKPAEYEKASGGYVVDLFSREAGDGTGAKICADSKLFWSMQQPAIDAKIEALKAEGWKAVERHDGYLDTWKWPKRGSVKKAEREGFTIFYGISNAGQFKVEDYARPDTKAAKGTKAATKSRGSDDQAELKSAAPEADAGEGQRAFTQGLTHDLRYLRGLQVKEAIQGGLGGLQLGLGVLLFMLITHDSRRGGAVAAGHLVCGASEVQKEHLPLMPSFADTDAEWKELFKLQRAGLWKRIGELDDRQLDGLLVHAAARIFSGQATSWHLGQLVLADNAVHGRTVFTPDEDFWKRTPKPYMVAQLKAIAGEKAAKLWGKQKTGDLAMKMGQWFTEPEKLTTESFGAEVTPDIISAFKMWVPAALKIPTANEAMAAGAEDDKDYGPDLDDEEFGDGEPADLDREAAE